MIKFRQNFFWIPLILVVVLAGFFLYKRESIQLPDLKEFSEDFGDEDTSTFSLNEKDIFPIRTQYYQHLKILEVSNSQLHSPVVSMVLNDKYQITKYSLDGLNLDSLADIKVIHRSSDVSSGYTYRVLDRGYFEFRYRAVKPDSANNIQVSVSGDSLEHHFIDENLLCLKGKLLNFSVRSNETPVNVFINGKGRALNVPHKIPSTIFFVKRNNKIYMLFIATLRLDDSIPGDSLREIIEP